jgi:hypothetical protein
VKKAAVIEKEGKAADRNEENYKERYSSEGWFLLNIPTDLIAGVAPGAKISGEFYQ